MALGVSACLGPLLLCLLVSENSLALSQTFAKLLSQEDRVALDQGVSFEFKLCSYAFSLQP